MLEVQLFGYEFFATICLFSCNEGMLQDETNVASLECYSDSFIFSSIIIACNVSHSLVSFRLQMGFTGAGTVNMALTQYVTLWFHW